MNRVTIDDNGFVNKQSCKQRHTRKREHKRTQAEKNFLEMKHENPVSSGHGLEILGVYKTARIMKAGTKENHHSFRNCEYKHTDETPKPPNDPRCNPQNPNR